MKAIIVFILLLGSCLFVPAQRRCSGTSYCSACTSCNYCKNCNKYGGSCGVCGGGEDVKRAKPSRNKSKPTVDNSYSPAIEHTYEAKVTDTIVSNSYEPVYDSHYKEEESGGGTTLLLILIAIILFIRWVNNRSK